jgi:hypothetical protein
VVRSTFSVVWGSREFSDSIGGASELAIRV